ncbi:hypothetical protein A2U01_0098861, partial [Trifolium medium]|nr:hypothetical protein [Trifolium medium]
SITTSREPNGMDYDAETENVTLKISCVDLGFVDLGSKVNFE